MRKPLLTYLFASLLLPACDPTPEEASRVSAVSGRPTALLDFGVGWVQTQYGAVVRGGHVDVHYQRSRLSACAAPTIISNARFLPGGQLFSSDEAFGFDVPDDADRVELWFHAVAPGCEEWDSNYGRNWPFPVIAAVPAGGGTADTRGGQREEISGANPGAAQSRGLLGSAPCTETAISVTCTYDHLDLSVDGSGLVNRRVYFQQPQGTPPAGGWPVVLLFQGSFFSAELSFQGVMGEPFGAYYQGLTVKQLLDAGFAVLAPQTHLVGTTFWDTDIPPWSFAWDLAPDNSFMLAIFDAIAGGKFGSLNSARLYAAGISSGGYMTSRMAVSYPGRFKALAIQSASYATCPVGPSCLVPKLPDDHPPTLFLAGLLDPLVPLWTIQAYQSRLLAEGHKAQLIVDDLASHEWIPAAPNAVVDWFLASP